MTHLRVTVSGIRNRTHVVYVASWLRHAVTTRGGSAGGPATLVEINGAGRIADEIERCDGLLADIDVRLVDHHPTTSGRHFFVSIGSPGTRAWARFRLSPSAWPLRTVVVDEGIGSYGTVATKRAAMRREGSREPFVSARAWAGLAAGRLLPDELWRLYERQGDRWTVNDVVASEFRRLRPQPQRQGHVVFLTQPWVDRGLIPESDYVAHLGRIAEGVTRAGVEFSVRPHPAERARRYSEFCVLGSELPAELDPDVLNAQLLLGETSTALLNLAAVQNVPAVRVVGPLAEVASIEFSRSQESLFSQFVPTSVTVAEIESAVGRLGR